MNPVYIVVIVVFLAVSFGVSQILARKNMAGGKQFIAEHPEAARIYLASKTAIASEAVYVATIDGEVPPYFSERGKNGLYALPGTRTLELQYTHNRPGIMYKNVTSSTGLVKKDFVVEANKTYLLGFDRKEETFTFTEQQA